MKPTRKNEGAKKTYMRASVEAFRTISSVEEERFVVLDERELIPQAFNLEPLTNERSSAEEREKGGWIPRRE